MTDQELNDLEENLPDDCEVVPFQDLIASIPSKTSITIANMIVVDMYLNRSNELRIACIKELGKRRSLGDAFDFESYIESELKKLPTIILIENKINLADLFAGVRKVK